MKRFCGGCGQPSAVCSGAPECLAKMRAVALASAGVRDDAETRDFVRRCTSEDAFYEQELQARKSVVVEPKFEAGLLVEVIADADLARRWGLSPDERFMVKVVYKTDGVSLLALERELNLYPVPLFRRV